MDDIDILDDVYSSHCIICGIVLNSRWVQVELNRSDELRSGGTTLDDVHVS